MLNWLRSALAGDDHAIPAGVQTTRDADGRIVSLEATLGTAPRAATAAPTMIDTDLDEGRRWIEAANERLVQTHHLGSETSFTLDQHAGALILRFEDHVEVRLAAQVLATWSPSENGFLWAWANPSIRSDLASDIASVRDRHADDALDPRATARPDITYAEMVALMGLACRDAKADGFYRCIADGMQVFLAIRTGSGDPPASVPNRCDVEEAMDVMRRYDAEMFEIDRLHAAGEGGLDGLARTVQLKKTVHDRYWTREDSYWDPCSAAWPSDHDPDVFRRRFVTTHDAGGLLCITVTGMHARVHHLRRMDGGLRIVDQLVDWGEGLLWPAQLAHAGGR